MPLLIIGADPYVYFYFIIKYSKCKIEKKKKKIQTCSMQIKVDGV